MRKSFGLGPLLVLIALAPAYAQTSPSTSRAIQTPPILRAKIAPVATKIPNDVILRTVQSKKEFIANAIGTDPASIGLSSAITLSPSLGELMVAGKVSIGGHNFSRVSPSSKWFEVRDDGSISIQVTPSAELRENLFLVSVTVAPRYGNRSAVKTRHFSNGIEERNEFAIDSRRTLNFVVQGDRNVAGEKLRVDLDGIPGQGVFQLDKVEITPITL